ncbi:MAG: AAA family ATPase [Gemmatimonadetes bacterium]|nr:AAA family ATPase [Gemmatimonadota bacterium]MYG15937.1 AAA family ATPase [Gemmatimonadota bacterium]
MNETEFRDRWERIRSHLRSAQDELNSADRFSKFVVERLREHEHAVRIKVDQNLAELGYDGTRIKEFQALSRQSSLLESYKANLDEVHAKLKNAEHSFEGQLADRRNLVAQQRVAFDRILNTVQNEFGGKITARRIDHGDRAQLESFVLKLSQRGITRWWNELSKDLRPSPETLLIALKNDELSKLRMSKAVQSTFRDSMIRSRQRELAAISCRDRYILELKLDDGDFRRLDDLSGGQRVSVLLSLLLQTNDGRPLVIDQPEDELDNRFLSETVLPALKKLKGRRQIIVATHNADIVVNGDADQVIQLEATANQGRVAEAGAIEKPTIRDAIVRTVDGGDDAFRLRQIKYGF